MVMQIEHPTRVLHSNTTDKKVTIKRRGDGVYDIYVNDKWVDARGNVKAAVSRVEELLWEE